MAFVLLRSACNQPALTSQKVGDDLKQVRGLVASAFPVFSAHHLACSAVPPPENLASGHHDDTGGNVLHSQSPYSLLIDREVFYRSVAGDDTKSLARVIVYVNSNES